MIFNISYCTNANKLGQVEKAKGKLQGELDDMAGQLDQAQILNNSMEKLQGGKAYRTPVWSVSLLCTLITPAASFCLR